MLNNLFRCLVWHIKNSVSNTLHFQNTDRIFSTQLTCIVLSIPAKFLQLMFLVLQGQVPSSFLSEHEAVLPSCPRPEDDSSELQADFRHPSQLILPLLSDSVIYNKVITLYKSEHCSNLLRKKIIYDIIQNNNISKYRVL